MSGGKRDAAAAGLTNGHSHSPINITTVTNGHSSSSSSSTHPTHPSPPSSDPSTPSASSASSASPSAFHSLFSRLRVRLSAVWPLSSSSSVLLCSLAFLWLTLDPHRRPAHLRTMLTFGPSALVNELAHLTLPLVSLPALYLLYRRLQSANSSGQWQLRASMAAHVLSAISLLTLIVKSVASRAAFRYALMHPGRLTAVAQGVLTSEREQSTNGVMAATHGSTLPAVMSPLSPITPPPSTSVERPSPLLPPLPSIEAVPSSATGVWSAAELSAIEAVGDMNVWRCVQAMLPAPVLSRWKDGIRVDRGVTYHVIEGQKKRQHLKLDVYHPPNSPLSHPPSSSSSASSSTSPLPPLFPLVIYVHGGGWITGDKRWGSIPLLTELAHSGHVVISINYRLAPYVRFPSFLIDIKRAIAYSKTHATTHWHANPTRTFLAGESAGGHLATLAALTANQPTYQPGFEHVDTSCVAVIDLYGVHSFVKGKDVKQQESFFDFLHKYVLTHSIRTQPSLYHAASPLSAVTSLVSSASPATTSPTLPYFFCAHGTNDTLVPIEDTWRFFAALLEARERERGAVVGGGEVLDVCVDVTGGSHAFNIVYNARCYALDDALGIWMARVVRAVDDRERREEEERERRVGEVTRWRQVIRAEMNKMEKNDEEGAHNIQSIQLHSSL